MRKAGEEESSLVVNEKVAESMQLNAMCVDLASFTKRPWLNVRCCCLQRFRVFRQTLRSSAWNAEEIRIALRRPFMKMRNNNGLGTEP
jgi:hypothetical protein